MYGSKETERDEKEEEMFNFLISLFKNRLTRYDIEENETIAAKYSYGHINKYFIEMLLIVNAMKEFTLNIGVFNNKWWYNKTFYSNKIINKKYHTTKIQKFYKIEKKSKRKKCII